MKIKRGKKLVIDYNNMLFTNITNDQIRTICREKIESLETWLRRLINDNLTNAFGPQYFNGVDRNGNYIIKSELRKKINNKIRNQPDRYSRAIDATLLEDCVYIICKKELFDAYFKEPLEEAFPDGKEEAKTFFDRLIIPRNLLSHANPISLRQAEQVICYSNDIIDSLKSYYLKKNLYMDYNVPMIIKYSDSLGNTLFRDQFQIVDSGSLIQFHKTPKYDLRIGDLLTIEIQVDQSFDESEYSVEWNINNRRTELSENRIEYKIQIRDVNQRFYIRCRVVSNKDWHRCSTYDDQLTIVFKVLQPI